MRYLNQIKWEITPITLPTVTKVCPKCSKQADYINTEKFRVNANKKSLDIWLIYQCSKCKSTLNLTLFERIHPKDLDANCHQLFLNNDSNLAREYGFNRSIHSKNNIVLNLDTVDYRIDGPTFNMETTQEMTIEISCQYPLDLRLDTVLSKKLDCSRSHIKKLFEESQIQSADATYRSKILKGRIVKISKK